MPNWCDNTVRIEGPVDKIYDLAVAVEAVLKVGGRINTGIKIAMEQELEYRA